MGWPPSRCLAHNFRRSSWSRRERDVGGGLVCQYFTLHYKLLDGADLSCRVIVSHRTTSSAT